MPYPKTPNFCSHATKVKIQNKFDSIYFSARYPISWAFQMRHPHQNDLFNCQGIQNKRPQNEKRRYSLMINRFQFTFLLSTISHFPNFCLLSACDVGLRELRQIAIDFMPLFSERFFKFVEANTQFGLFVARWYFSYSCLQYMIECYECKFQRDTKSDEQIAFCLFFPRPNLFRSMGMIYLKCYSKSWINGGVGANSSM